MGLESAVLSLDCWLDYSVEPSRPVVAAAVATAAAASVAFAVVSRWTAVAAAAAPRLVENWAFPWR